MPYSALSQKERLSPNPESRRPEPAGSEVEMGDLSNHDSDDEEVSLTAQELGAGRSRARSNSWKDGTTPREQPGSSMLAGVNLADAKIIQHLTVNAVLIGLWYTFSLSISLYNQWMFSGDHLNFKFPLFTTCMHMLVQFILASLVLFFFPRFRPQLPPNAAGSDSSAPLMTRSFYITRIGPCGAATGLDIGLGNTSMRFITLTFYTMCKSSVLGFVLLFAFIFGLERPSLKLLGIIAVMTCGVILMVAGETAFHLGGFFLIMSAACFSGFRWALTQILLLRNPATSNPFSSLFYLAPIMFVTLFVIAIPAEGFAEVAVGLGELTKQKGLAGGIALLLFPGTLAFCMTASEFALLKRTSVVTLSVCGIFKEVVTIITAQSTLDHDSMTPINIAGLVITIASIATYNYMKIIKMRREAQEQLKQGREPQVGILAEEQDEATRPMLGEDLRRDDDDFEVAHSPTKRARDQD